MVGTWRISGVWMELMTGACGTVSGQGPGFVLIERAYSTPPTAALMASRI